MKGNEKDNFRMLCIYSFLFFFIRASSSLDSIAPSQFIRDGETLVSPNGNFELGFFSPGDSKGRYVGVWYKSSPSTVVWVANRETRLNTTSGVLEVNDQGILLLKNGTSTVWSSNISSKASNPIAQLLDSGNLVVRNGNDSNLDNLLWQSFDYPCDTLMPGMKLGWNLERGLDRFLSSWKSPDDPGQGDYIVKIDLTGYPQAVHMEGTVIKRRTGSWNGLTFTGYPNPMPNPTYSEFVNNEKKVYYEYELRNKSVLSRYVVLPSGIGQLLFWTSKTSSWDVISTAPADQCESYALCGEYSICNISNTPICLCLKGFVPKHPEEWNMSYWSNGCIRSIPLECNNNDGFQRYMGMKLPDTSSSWYSKTMDLKECQESCLENCSCTAFANLDIRGGGSGCLLWFDGVIDIRQLSQRVQDLYIRVAASELDHAADYGHGKINKKKLLVGIVVGSLLLLMSLIIIGLRTSIWKKKLRKPGMATIFYWKHHKSKLRKEDMDLPTFDFSIIAEATNNFSSNNKLGEGGFGSVYKGTLRDGQELAVKRLSKNSGQGLVEFKNEVVLIAKLQHRNLVKLLGFCIQGEKMLIYEYMPNKSLDYFIFDETRRMLLDWLKRFHIIGGIARGLLYLHQDSRLRIIHRDLKISNILLDAHMNPKISDFGLARSFGGDQVEDNTNRVVGTYGYMPPEYAVHGHYSVKSDVFSFGVIVLEIVSGKKNRRFSDPEHNLNLLGHAWRLWTEERPLELIDKFLGERCTPSEFIRCIHVGLLCVQQKPEDRPEMSSVVLMLNGEKLLPKPKAPGFYSGRDLSEADSMSRNCNQFSPNEISLTVFEAR